MYNDNTIKFEPRKTGYYNPEIEKTKPVSTNKDFRKVLSKESREEKPGAAKKKLEKKPLSKSTEESEDIASEESEAARESRTVSLFDLHKGDADSDISQDEQPEKSQEIVTQQPHEVNVEEAPKPFVESPSQLFAKMSSTKKEEKIHKPSTVDPRIVPATKHEEAPTIEQPQMPASPINTFTSRLEKGKDEGTSLFSKKEKEPSLFSREQPDISAINPNAMQAALNATPLINPITPTKPIEPPKPISTNLQEIVDQIVEAMHTIQTDGKIETVITLKNDVFKDVHLTVTTYETAKGEFNIKFDNLTQAAKHILDQQTNRDSLLLTLQKEGYNVHIITTTTYNEETIFADKANLPDERREREQHEGDERERERREEA